MYQMQKEIDVLEDEQDLLNFDSLNKGWMDIFLEEICSEEEELNEKILKYLKDDEKNIYKKNE